jgi:hypothetical protein
MATVMTLSSTGYDHSTGWDWENKHVNESFKIGDKSADPNPTDIMEAGTVLICAAPASLSTALADTLTGGAGSVSGSGVNIVPIGMVEQAQVAQSKPLQRIFEIGSKLSYIIPGRVVGQISLSRVLFDGPSLLKCLYQGEVKTDGQATDGTKHVVFASGAGSGEKGFQPIGSGQIAMNLASTFFDQSVGLVFFFKDRQSENVSTMYFEGCRVATHSLGIAAGMNVMSESISMEFIRVVPVIVAAKTISSNVKDADGKLYDIPIMGDFIFATSSK